MPQAPAPIETHGRGWLRRFGGAATRPIRRTAWRAAQVARHGRPRLLVTYGDGLGDHLLCTALFRELRQRGQRGLWMMSQFPDLFAGNPDIDAVVPPDWRYHELIQAMGARSVMPIYSEIDEKEDRSIPPDRHIITCMCRHLEIGGPVSLRPYVHLTDAEKAQGRIAPNQVAIQSSILAARLPIGNKEWRPQRFAQVVQAARGRYQFVQLGSPDNPPLEGALDLRGKTSLRQTAAILSQSLCFVGLVGFVMHLARAVDCRGVIVFGGREGPWQSGYSCNENLFTPMPCSPCWYWNRCDHGHECMNRIGAAEVVAALDRQAALHGQPLAVDTDVLPEPARRPARASAGRDVALPLSA
ncbi:MAG: glycosyltransferase family 9 protein [Phycisphaeraceae bacterium]